MNIKCCCKQLDFAFIYKYAYEYLKTDFGQRYEQLLKEQRFWTDVTRTKIANFAKQTFSCLYFNCHFPSKQSPISLGLLQFLYLIIIAVLSFTWLIMKF